MTYQNRGLVAAIDIVFDEIERLQNAPDDKVKDYCSRANAVNNMVRTAQENYRLQFDIVRSVDLGDQVEGQVARKMIGAGE